jgi:hypothetical protein
MGTQCYDIGHLKLLEFSIQLNSIRFFSHQHARIYVLITVQIEADKLYLSDTLTSDILPYMDSDAGHASAN